MVEVNSEKEHLDLMGRLKKNLIQNDTNILGCIADGWYSMGLLFYGGEWRWNLSGLLTNESFTAWDDGHPRDNMLFALMDFNNAGRWVSHHSSTNVLPLCEKLAAITKPVTNAAITTTTDHAQNPDDAECRLPWVQILNGCYLIGWEASSWLDGRSFCLDRGGYLLQVNSEEEQNSVTGNEAVFFSSLDKNKKNMDIFWII